MDLHVGQAALRGDIARYAERFDLLELRADPGKLPRAARLRQWKTEVPASFVFSVVLPRVVALLDAKPESEKALADALTAASALGASWLLLQTPPQATPSSRTRRRLAELVERLRRAERRIAWEPHGLWEDRDAEALADQLGVALVRDVSRSAAPEGDAVYARMRALGDAGRVRSSAIERVADEIAGRREAFVVIEGHGALRAARLLRELAGLVQTDDGTDEGDDESGLDDDAVDAGGGTAESERDLPGDDDEDFADDDSLDDDELDDDDDANSLDEADEDDR
jgi:uncharacterized protein YecE (DUF72 family)